MFKIKLQQILFRIYDKRGEIMTNNETLSETELHQLPLTQLEMSLKEAFLQRKDMQDHILSSEEMQDYYTWMATNYNSHGDYSPSIIQSGDIGKLGRYLLKNPKDISALSKLISLSPASPESNTFAEDQDIAICRPLRYLPPYWHTSDYFEVYYIFSGECPIYFEEECITLVSGDVIIIPPHIKNATVFTSDNVVLLDTMIRSSTFRQVFLEQLSPSNIMSAFFNKALYGKNISNYLLFRTGTNNRLERLLVSIFNASICNDLYSARMLNPLVSTFFLQLLKDHEDIVSLSPHGELHWKTEFTEMLIYIQTNYRNVTIKKLSDMFGYSERQIIRIIHSSTDRSFTELLTQIRMEKAAVLLKRNCSAEKTAAEIGYSSLSGFYQAFSNYYGKTPAEFKRAIK